MLVAFVKQASFHIHLAMKKALWDSFVWRGIYFITTLLLNICIARIYEADKSGWIYFISNNFYLVLLVGGLSLDSSMTYFSASNRISSDKLVLFSLSWPFLVALFSLVCTGILIKTNYITSDIWFLLVAGAAYTFGISLTNFFTSLFYAKQDFVMPNVLMSIINLVVIIFIPFFAKGFWGLDREQFLYVYFLQFILQGICLGVLYISKYSSNAALKYPNKDEYRSLFRFASVALFANVAYYLISRVDYLFVEAWCSAKSLGNYVQVSKMGQLFLIIPSIISSAVYPRVAMGQDRNILAMLFKMMFLFSLLYVFIFTVSCFFADPVFKTVFGHTFNEMYLPFLLLLPGIFFLSCHTIISAYFGGKNKPSYNLLSTAVGLLIVLAGDLLIIKRMGIAGAAIVSTVGYFAALVVAIVLLLRESGSKMQDFISLELFRYQTYTALFNAPQAKAK